MVAEVALELGELLLEPIYVDLDGEEVLSGLNSFDFGDLAGVSKLLIARRKPILHLLELSASTLAASTSIGGVFLHHLIQDLLLCLWLMLNKVNFAGFILLG